MSIEKEEAQGEQAHPKGDVQTGRLRHAAHELPVSSDDISFADSYAASALLNLSRQQHSVTALASATRVMRLDQSRSNLFRRGVYSTEAKSSRQKAAQRTILRVDRLLGKLRTMETTANMQKVKHRLLNGQFFFRGFDKERRPIIWMKSFREIRGLRRKEYGDYFLPFVWIVLWALAQSPGQTREIRFVMFDTPSRPTLDFNMDFTAAFGIMLGKLARALPILGPFTIISSRPGFSLSKKSLKAACSSQWRKMIRFEKDGHFLPDVVCDPSVIPHSMMMDHTGGSTLSAAELGHYSHLLGGTCFADMCPAVFCFPSAPPFSAAPKEQSRSMSLVQPSTDVPQGLVSFEMSPVSAAGRDSPPERSMAMDLENSEAGVMLPLSRVRGKSTLFDVSNLSAISEDAEDTF